MVCCLELNEDVTGFDFAIRVVCGDPEIDTVIVVKSLDGVAAEERLPLDEVHAKVCDDVFPCPAFSSGRLFASHSNSPRLRHRLPISAGVVVIVPSGQKKV